MTKHVLIAGATGMLGQQIASALLDTGQNVRLLVRGGASHPRADELEPLVARGATIALGDLSQHDMLDTAVEGCTHIISAVQGGPDAIIDGQVSLAAAGKRAGVARIFPSDFAVDFRAIAPEAHLFFSWRQAANARIAGLGLPQTNIFNGAFAEMLTAEFFGLVDWQDHRIVYWGDADQIYDFTTTADTAQLAAAAIALDPPIDGALQFAGDSRSPRELAEIVSKVTGRAFGLAPLGSLEALDIEIATRQSRAPDDPMQWAALQYHRAMASGAGRLTDLANVQFVDLNPMSIEAFLVAHRPQ